MGELGKVTTKALLLILELVVLVELLVLPETVARDTTPVMPNATKQW